MSRKTAKPKKANARSPKVDRRREILTAAERIVPFEERPEIDAPTSTRLNRNVTASLVLLELRGQRIAACEEMAELTHLLCREANGKSVSVNAVQEEIADCYIVLAQMSRMYFAGRADFNVVMNRKLASAVHRRPRKCEYVKLPDIDLVLNPHGWRIGQNKLARSYFETNFHDADFAQ